MKNSNKASMGFTGFLAIVFILVGLFTHNGGTFGSNQYDYDTSSIEDHTYNDEETTEHNDNSAGNNIDDEDSKIVTYDTMPEYKGVKDVSINDNVSDFSESEIEDIKELTYGRGYYFEDLDELDRPGTAVALLTPDMYHTNENTGLLIDPIGWSNERLLDDSRLYSRTYLINYSFVSADVNVRRNLITGTSDFKTSTEWGMLKYEDIIKDYLAKDGSNYHLDNELVYQVTPVFKGLDLIPKGVQIRATSLHDDSLDFNVFIFNRQDGVEINYSNGNFVDNTETE